MCLTQSALYFHEPHTVCSLLLLTQFVLFILENLLLLLRLDIPPIINFSLAE
jgi:hypothetical protein